MFSCEIVNEMTVKLIHILKEAGLLVRGDKIEIFLFIDYDFNSVENLILHFGILFTRLDSAWRNIPCACLQNT